MTTCLSWAAWMRISRPDGDRLLVESRMRGNVHVRFGGRERGNGTRETWPPRPLPTRHLSYDDHAADLLYKVINPRYEKRRSLIVTTNLAFKDWNSVFPNATCIVTLIDRLTHHADVTAIDADSYRRRESETEAAARRKRKP